MTKRQNKGLIFVVILTILCATVLVAGVVRPTSEVYASDFDYTNSVFVIESQADFDAFAQLYNNKSNKFPEKKIELRTDVDMAKSPFHLPTLQGVFDGNGHTIKNVTSALFGELHQDGRILNLNLNGVSIKNGAAVVTTNLGLVKNVDIFGKFEPSVGSQTAGIAVTNRGTINNCYNFCTYSVVRADLETMFGGIALSNSGTIQTSGYYGDMSISASIQNISVAGLTLENIGTVTSGSVFSSVTFTAEVEQTAAKIYPLTKGGTDTTVGTVNSSYALTSISNAPKTNATSDIWSLDNPVYTEIAQSYAIYRYGRNSGDTEQGFVSENLAFVNFDTVELAQYLTPDKLGGGYIFDFGYPIGKTVFDGLGTLNSPFLVDSVTDVFKMRASVGGEAEFALKGDIRIDGYEQATSLAAFEQSAGNLNGQGFAFIGGNQETVTLYAVSGANIGYIRSDVRAFSASGAETVLYRDGEYDFGRTEIQRTEIVGTQPTGGGTKVNPYRIANAEQLKWLDGKAGFAVLDRDIAVNLTDGQHKLNMTQLNIVLSGNGHSIVGLIDEPLAKELSANGKLINLTLRGYDTTGGGLVAESLNGTAERVTVVGTASGSLFGKTNGGVIQNSLSLGSAVTAGFVQQNVGRIENSDNRANGAEYAFSKENSGTVDRCENWGTVTYAFTPSDTGVTKNSVNSAANVGYHAQSSGITASFGTADSGYVLFEKGQKFTYPTLDYTTVVTHSSFDLEKVFGYIKNGNSNLPELRREGGVYKTAPAFKTYVLGNTVYAPAGATPLSLIEQQTTTASSFGATFTWLYNGEPFVGTEVHDAGTYVLKAEYSGNGDYLPSQFTNTFIIKQAPSGLGVADDFTELSFVYTGDEIVIPTFVPPNAAELNEKGYTLEYFTTQNGKPSPIYGVGTYRQKVVATSLNYLPMQAERTVTVTKADLGIRVNDAETNYLSGIDRNALSTTVVFGLVGADADKSLADLVGTEYAKKFMTAYVAGMDAGTYRLGFGADLSNYRITQVTEGTLTVKEIPYPQGGIYFYGASRGIDGSAKFVYSGKAVSIAADNIPDGTSVEYSGNGERNAGTYTVSATLTSKNYLPLVLNVKVTIEKAQLSVSVGNAKTTYGEAFDPNTIGIVVEGFVGTDTESLLDGRSRTVSVWKDGADVSGTKFAVGSYQLRGKISGEELLNYKFIYSDGTMTVDKATLHAFYQNNGQTEDEFSNIKKTYDGEVVNRRLLFFDNAGIAVSVQYEYLKNGVPIAPESLKNAGLYTVKATVTPMGEIADNYETTVYSCIVTIDKIKLSIHFLQANYTFTYMSKSYVDMNNFAYDGNLPDGIVPVLTCVDDSNRPADGIRAGRYTVTLTVAERDNYTACNASAVMTIVPAVLDGKFKTEFVYSGESVVVIMEEIAGVYNDEIRSSDFSYAFTTETGIAVMTVINAGNYFLTVTLNNKDYSLKIARFPLKVEKLNLDVVFGEVTFDYGTLGEVQLGNSVFFITESVVTWRNHRTVNGTTVDLGITLREKNAGLYALTNTNLLTTTNYKFQFTQESVAGNQNKVVIRKRVLNTYWKVDGKSISSTTYETLYMGVSQTYRFDFTIENLVDGDIEQIEKKVTGKSDDVWNCGQYSLTLNLKDSINYELDKNQLTVNVERAELRFVGWEINVVQGSPVMGLGFDVTGQLGADKGKPWYELPGATLTNKNYIHEYTLSSPVNMTYEVTLDPNIKLENYTVVLIKAGKITVIANVYPDYILKDVTYIYNGEFQTVPPLTVPPEIRVTYSNHSHRDAGRYLVTATVVYPSGKQSQLACTMEIIKATPTVTVDPVEIIFTDDTILDAGVLTGVGTHSGKTVAGSFAFAEDFVLQNGAFRYTVLFTPADLLNYNSVTSTVLITSAPVNLTTFVFSDIEKLTFDGDKVLVNGVVTLTLRPVLTNLTLWRNGVQVEFVELNKTELVQVEIRYKEQTAYAYDFDVIFSSVAPPKEEITLESFKLENLTFKNGVLVVGAEGGRLQLSADLQSKYALYVNGAFKEVFSINGDEGNITVTIKNIKLNKVVYAEAFEIRIGDVGTDDPKTIDKKIYFIIGGCVLGGALLVAAGILIWKKKYWSMKRRG